MVVKCKDATTHAMKSLCAVSMCWAHSFFLQHRTSWHNRLTLCLNSVLTTRRTVKWHFASTESKPHFAVQLIMTLCSIRYVIFVYNNILAMVDCKLLLRSGTVFKTRCRCFVHWPSAANTPSNYAWYRARLEHMWQYNASRWESVWTIEQMLCLFLVNRYLPKCFA